VPTIIIEKNDRPGDSWRKRYKSLCLHDPVWYDHLPYLQVPRSLAGLLAEGQDRRLAGDAIPR
jgi:cation diffusion facilitator CzcD-associated flavoprotein CzcO